jgi:BirA family transcriptional regulator, biotin operon repressor / biotin---[acetyl-CoA-carboxylase] ligase
MMRNAQGRGSNTWLSPVGCLCCTVKLPISQPAVAPRAQFVVAVAIHDALSALIARIGAVSWDAARAAVRLKWPNDVYLNGAKLAGILCQLVSGEDGRFSVICGFGVNVTNVEPGASLAAAFPGAWSRELVLAEILSTLEAFWTAFDAAPHDMSTIVARYTDAWLHTGQQVRITDSEHLHSITGIDADGYLLARDVLSGRTATLAPVRLCGYSRS